MYMIFQFIGAVLGSAILWFMLVTQGQRLP